MKANQEIREIIEKNRIKHYEVASKVGVSDTRFSVWLRTELEGERKERTLKAINELISKEKIK